MLGIVERLELILDGNLTLGVGRVLWWTKELSPRFLGMKLARFDSGLTGSACVVPGDLPQAMLKPIFTSLKESFENFSQQKSQ